MSTVIHLHVTSQSSSHLSTKGTHAQVFSHCIGINVLLPTSPWKLITHFDSYFHWINIAEI